MISSENALNLMGEMNINKVDYLHYNEFFSPSLDLRGPNLSQHDMFVHKACTMQTWFAKTGVEELHKALTGPH